ncbi:MAG: methyltransferase domain-containing protein [Chloroflexota bacterium]
MTAPRVLLFIPTYNEAHNVERLCAELSALELGADILFMDDASPDGTGETLDRLARLHPGVVVVHREAKLGIGSAHRAGIRYAYDHGYGLLVTLDADFSHASADILRVFAAHGDGVDVVVASRFLQAGSLPGWKPHRRLLTLLGHVVTRALLGLPYDATGALRLYDLRRIDRGLFDLTTAQAYPFFFESLLVLHLNGCRVREIPIALPARVYGSSKLTALEALRSARFLLRLSMARIARPDRLRGARPIDRRREELRELQGWDRYWSDKRDGLGTAYDVVAGLYRRLVIKRNLDRCLARHLPDSGSVLHAGCGSGEVDVDLHARLRVTAIDISERALDRYARNNPRAHRIEQASIFDLPFAAASFDGVFNLGVLEHFSPDEIREILREFHRVLRPGGKAVMFWPHRWASSAMVLRLVRGLIRLTGRRAPEFHPPEVSLLRSRREADALLRDAGLVLWDYEFGPRDFFVQAVVVALKPVGGAERSLPPRRAARGPG